VAFLKEIQDGKERDSFSWVGHLEELRRRLFIILGAAGLASIAGFVFSEQLFHILTRPIAVFQEKLYFLSPYEAFLVRLKIAFFSGLILSSPVTLAQIWFFAAPGLYEKEKRSVLYVVGGTAICFMAGVLLAFFWVMPFALSFFLGFQTPYLRPLISIQEYIAFLTSLLLSFGIAFVFPVFLILLVKLGILKASTLAKQRRLAVLLIFVGSAVLTPSTDVISQLLLAVPLMILLEISIAIARRMEKKK
jgi:sec-independent protein translocase protein TatC